MSVSFFDTSALVPRYRPGKFTYRVNTIFRGKGDIFIAEITMVEIVSAFASTCRDGNLADAEFYRMQSDFLRDVASGRIQIRPITRADMVRAIHLLTLGGVVNRRGLKSSDALVATSCRQMAFETGHRPTFYTKDWKLYRTLYEISAFRAAMKLRFLGPGRDNVAPSTK